MTSPTLLSPSAWSLILPRLLTPVSTSSCVRLEAQKCQNSALRFISKVSLLSPFNRLLISQIPSNNLPCHLFHPLTSADDQFYGGVTPNKPIPGVSGIPQNMVTLLFQLDPENPVILGELHVNSAYNLECSLGKTFTLGFGASVSTVCKDKNPGPSPPPGASNERAFTFSFFWSYDN